MIKVEKDFAAIPADLPATPPRISDAVRARLEAVYSKKCCYCEDSHIKGEVEHFYPKSIFPDREFLWHNLLWACHDCNNIKGAKYDENQRIINPEVDDPETMITFEVDGTVRPQNNEAQATINACGLNRVNLKDKRKEVVDEFIRNIELTATLGGKSKVAEYIDACFIRPINDNKELRFIAFRKFIVEHCLSEILSEYC